MKKRLKIVGVIPARYDSSRFRGKVLADICGKSMLQRVYERSMQSELLDDLYIATDDENVKTEVKLATEFKGDAKIASKLQTHSTPFQ
ncbi:MAG: hypothetical protein GY756_25600 [bacterium]|nr:hypothetical protein [bacterium]